MMTVDLDRHSGRSRAGAIFLVLAGIFLQTGTAEAQEWRFEPLLRAGLEYDDNARLDTRTDEQVELNGWLAEVAATMAYASERSTFSATPRALVRRYSDNPEFDSDDIFFVARHTFDGTRNDFGFRLQFDQQQVRTAERSDTDLNADDPGEVEDDSTGRVLLFGERAKWTLAPYWRYRMTEDSQIGLDVTYYDVQYDDELKVRLRDYTDGRVNLTFRRSFSPNTSGAILATYRRFDKELFGLDPVEGYGAQIGFTHDISSQTVLRAMAGVESADDGITDRVTEPVADISLRHDLETIRLLAFYRRIIGASGNGQLSVRDSLMLTATRQLTEKISAGVGLRAYQSKNLSQVLQDDREQVQLRANFTWRFTRSFSTSIDYRYTVLDRGGLVESESANSNQVNLWFAYEPRSRDR